MPRKGSAAALRDETHKAIAIDTLDRMTAILSGELRLKLIPGMDWASNRHTRVITYPRAALLEKDELEATGDLWRCVQHAVSSWGEYDAYDLAVDTMVAAQKRAGVRAVHARWILGVIQEVERERVERIARSHARNLGRSALPPRGSGYRKAEAAHLRAALALPDTDGADYWQRVALACGGLCAGTIVPDDLPVDMPWDGLHEQIKALADAPSYDALLLEVEKLIPEMSARWITHLSSANPPPPPDPGAAAGMPGAGGGRGGSAKGAPGSGGDAPEGTPGGESEEADGPEQEAPGAPSAASPKSGPEEHADSEEPGTEPAPGESLADALREALERAVNEESTERAGIDFFEGEVRAETDLPQGEPAAGWGTGAAMEEMHQPGPAWNAVSRSNAAITAPIRRVFQKYLVNNEIGEVQTGTRGGRLRMSQAIKPAIVRTTSPFCRRTAVGDVSYDIGFIIDHSGSMHASTGEPGFPEAFGDDELTRWQLAARMAVALSEAITAVNGVTTTLVAYDSYVKLVKRHDEPLTPVVKQRVMDTIRPQGDNADAEAIREMMAALLKAPGQRKLIFHLTDGQFCSSAIAMERAVSDLRSKNIGYVVLTLGMGAHFAQRYVPEDCAEEITDETVGRILAKHLTRMLKAA